MSSARFDNIRLLEALLFAAREPVRAEDLAQHLPEGANAEELLGELAALYANRGVCLVQIGKAWAFRTAPDLAPKMKLEQSGGRKLSRVAMETLAIVAYHQPVTRAEVEEVRGVGLSKGTLDILLEAGWVKPKGRRRTPGRPVTWGTTQAFLDHFGLSAIDDLPGVAELKAAGMLDARPAMTTLGERGLLPDAGEAREDHDDDEDGEDDEAGEVERLSDDFGEDLVPEEGPVVLAGE